MPRRGAARWLAGVVTLVCSPSATRSAPMFSIDFVKEPEDWNQALVLGLSVGIGF